MLREVCEWAVRPDPGAVAGHTKASEERTSAHTRTHTHPHTHAHTTHAHTQTHTSTTHAHIHTNTLPTVPHTANHATAVARHVSVIVYTLVETSLESLESSPPAPLTDLLRYLATCPAPPVRAAIARFDPPFPAAPEYRELALLYEGKRGSGSSLRTRIPLDHAHIRTDIHTHMHTHIHVRTHIHTLALTYIHTHTCAHIHTAHPHSRPPLRGAHPAVPGRGRAAHVDRHAMHHPRAPPHAPRPTQGRTPRRTYTHTQTHTYTHIHTHT